MPSLVLLATNPVTHPEIVQLSKGSTVGGKQEQASAISTKWRHLRQQCRRMHRKQWRQETCNTMVSEPMPLWQHLSFVKWKIKFAEQIDSWWSIHNRQFCDPEHFTNGLAAKDTLCLQTNDGVLECNKKDLLDRCGCGCVLCDARTIANVVVLENDEKTRNNKETGKITFTVWQRRKWTSCCTLIYNVKKHCEVVIGSCVQDSNQNDPASANEEMPISGIFLTTLDVIQGGFEVLQVDLKTGKLITRHDVKKISITKEVIQRVEQLAKWERRFWTSCKTHF